ncbi:hypothetical protein NRB20_62980 [Nocardia sp. RB20]|uniref:Uncharacterized protein n=1 Tax=Nocardia macrotermitis TaxID=2585198 RepID=A0A7K0DCB4_9NOCA|nr:hypothetical protein [Nocardia macrotermitis]
MLHVRIRAQPVQGVLGGRVVLHAAALTGARGSILGLDIDIVRGAGVPGHDDVQAALGVDVLPDRDVHAARALHVDDEDLALFTGLVEDLLQPRLCVHTLFGHPVGIHRDVLDRGVLREFRYASGQFADQAVAMRQHQLRSAVLVVAHDIRGDPVQLGVLVRRDVVAAVDQLGHLVPRNLRDADAVVLVQPPGHAGRRARRAGLALVVLVDQLLRAEFVGAARIVADPQPVLGLDGLGQTAVPPALGRGLRIEHHLVRGLIDDQHPPVVDDEVVLVLVFPLGRRGHVQPADLLLGQLPPQRLLQLGPPLFGERGGPAVLSGLPTVIDLGQHTVARIILRETVIEHLARAEHLLHHGWRRTLTGPLREDVGGVGMNQRLVDLIDGDMFTGRNIAAQMTESDVLHGADVDRRPALDGFGVGVVRIHPHDVETHVAQRLQVPLDLAIGQVVARGEHLNRTVFDGVDRGARQEHQRLALARIHIDRAVPDRQRRHDLCLTQDLAILGLPDRLDHRREFVCLRTGFEFMTQRVRPGILQLQMLGRIFAGPGVVVLQRRLPRRPIRLGQMLTANPFGMRGLRRRHQLVGRLVQHLGMLGERGPILLPRDLRITVRPRTGLVLGPPGLLLRPPHRLPRLIDPPLRLRNPRFLPLPLPRSPLLSLGNLPRRPPLPGIIPPGSRIIPRPNIILSSAVSFALRVGIPLPPRLTSIQPPPLTITLDVAVTLTLRRPIPTVQRPSAVTCVTGALPHRRLVVPGLGITRTRPARTCTPTNPGAGWIGNRLRHTIFPGPNLRRPRLGHPLGSPPRAHAGLPTRTPTIHPGPHRRRTPRLRTRGRITDLAGIPHLRPTAPVRPLGTRRRPRPRRLRDRRTPIPHRRGLRRRGPHLTGRTRPHPVPTHRSIRPHRSPRRRRTRAIRHHGSRRTVLRPNNRSDRRIGFGSRTDDPIRFGPRTGHDPRVAVRDRIPTAPHTGLGNITGRPHPVHIGMHTGTRRFDTVPRRRRTSSRGSAIPTRLMLSPNRIHTSTRAHSCPPGRIHHSRTTIRRLLPTPVLLTLRHRRHHVIPVRTGIHQRRTTVVHQGHIPAGPDVHLRRRRGRLPEATVRVIPVRQSMICAGQHPPGRPRGEHPPIRVRVLQILDRGIPPLGRQIHHELRGHRRRERAHGIDCARNGSGHDPGRPLPHRIRQRPVQGLGRGTTDRPTRRPGHPRDDRLPPVDPRAMPLQLLILLNRVVLQRPQQSADRHMP